MARVLEGLAQAPPEWLVDPSRLMLEHGADGRLVLLGSGFFSHVYHGWLLPEPIGQQPSAGTPAAAAASAVASPPVDLEASAGGGGERRVAVKVLNQAGDVAAFLREAGLLHRLRGSPHVVPLLGACVLDQQLLLITELLEVRSGWLGGWVDVSCGGAGPAAAADYSTGAHVGGWVIWGCPLASPSCWPARL